MSTNHKKVCMALKYIEKSLILVSAITECVLISAFTLLLAIPVGIASSEIGLRFFPITVLLNN